VGFKLRVPAWSIDDLSDEYGVPDVVFIDVEGFEHEPPVGGSGDAPSGPGLVRGGSSPGACPLRHSFFLSGDCATSKSRRQWRSRPRHLRQRLQGTWSFGGVLGLGVAFLLGHLIEQFGSALFSPFDLIASERVCCAL
jgi:hypothetical protein